MKNIFLLACYIFFTKSAVILADNRQSGIPPPGWTLPPQKYKFSIFLEKLGCLKKADNLLLLEGPYNAPKCDCVLFLITWGVKTSSVSIYLSISIPKFRVIFFLLLLYFTWIKIKTFANVNLLK